MESATGTPIQRRSMSAQMRTTIVWIHRWISLVTGLLLIVVTLSGAILVFRPEIDHLLYPHLHRTTPGNSSITQAYQAVRRAYPDRQIARMSSPTSSGGAYEFSLRGKPRLLVYVDPGSNTILGTINDGASLTDWLFTLHSSLFLNTLFPDLERPGDTVVGILGVLLFLLAITGIIVWWPTPKKLALAFTIRWQRGWYIRHYDLHKVIGILTAPILLIIALTGITFQFGEQARNIWYTTTFTDDPSTAARKLQSHPQDTTVSLDKLTILASQIAPDGGLARISFPQTITGTIQLRMSVPFDPNANNTAAGNLRLYFDRYSGALLQQQDLRSYPIAAQIFESWRWPLHIGTWGGTWTKVLYLLMGLSPTVLAITGAATWSMRWRARRKCDTRKKPVGIETPATA